MGEIFDGILVYMFCERLDVGFENLEVGQWNAHGWLLLHRL